MPDLVKDGLPDRQVAAIEGLQASLRRDKRRAFVQMAAGAGETFTAHLRLQLTLKTMSD